MSFNSLQAQPPKALMTILLVDDEQIILDSTGMALELMGYQVLRASNGLEAVEVFQAHAGEIDLVLMDLTMPKLNGYEAFRRIRALHPEARIVMSSGYNEQDSLAPLFQEGLQGFIQKPYLLKELREFLLQHVSIG